MPAERYHAGLPVAHMRVAVAAVHSHRLAIYDSVRTSWRVPQVPWPAPSGGTRAAGACDLPYDMVMAGGAMWLHAQAAASRDWS